MAGATCRCDAARDTDLGIGQYDGATYTGAHGRIRFASEREVSGMAKQIDRREFIRETAAGVAAKGLGSRGMGEDDLCPYASLAGIGLTRARP